VRPLAQEAWRCYNAGAIRASIAATWTAVTADIITKLIRLADGPRRLWNQLEHIQHLWASNGSPKRHHIGITVDTTGEHRVWLGGPANTLEQIHP
jgi:hypothetical protein